MQKPLKTLLSTFFLLTILVFPSLTFAVGDTPGAGGGQLAEDTFEVSITDGTVDKGFVPCSGNGCSACDFVVMANTIIKWLIGISFLFFALLAVIAGFKLITAGGNPGALRDAKSSFTNAFIGLIIILAAWVLVDTLMRTLTQSTDGTISGHGPWSQIQCGSQTQSAVEVGYYSEDREDVGVSTVYNAPRPAGTAVTPVAQGSMTSLRSIGVKVASWPGIDGPGRTDRVHPTVAQAVLNMQNQGKSANNGRYVFQVTAAYTQNVGHSSGSQHYRGTAVDLQPINGGTYNQIIQLCRQAGFTFINDERSANHIHCDMR